MSNTTYKKITNTGTETTEIYVIDSASIKVFPCSYRGSSYASESRRTTEHNLINLTGNNKTAVISKSGNTLKCTVKGYYFEISGFNDEYKVLGIKITAAKEASGTYDDHLIDISASTGAINTVLDKDDTYFYGLGFAKGTEAFDSTFATLNLQNNSQVTVVGTDGSTALSLNSTGPTNTVTLSSNTNVSSSGSATFSAISSANDVAVGGKLTVSGSTIAASTAHLSVASASITGGLSAVSANIANGITAASLTVNSGATINGTLTVETFSPTDISTVDLTVQESIAATGALASILELRAENISVTNVTPTSTATPTFDATGALTTLGSATIATLNVTGNSTLTTLNVGTVTATGDIAAATNTISAATLSAATLSVTAANVTNNLYTGSLTVATKCTFSGAKDNLGIIFETPATEPETEPNPWPTKINPASIETETLTIAGTTPTISAASATANIGTISVGTLTATSSLDLGNAATIGATLSTKIKETAIAGLTDGYLPTSTTTTVGQVLISGVTTNDAPNNTWGDYTPAVANKVNYTVHGTTPSTKTLSFYKCTESEYSSLSKDENTFYIVVANTTENNED